MYIHKYIYIYIYIHHVLLFLFLSLMWARAKETLWDFLLTFEVCCGMPFAVLAACSGMLLAVPAGGGMLFGVLFRPLKLGS